MRVRNYHISYINNTQVHTVGCEMSASDANKFASTLDTFENNIVFSTCSFLGEKEQECLTFLKLLRKLNPNYNFYILGCDVENNRDRYDFGTIISKEELKERISGVVEKTDSEEELYIKIQDGCPHKCTYCIVNQLRPKPYSVPFKDILATLEEHRSSDICIAGTEITSYYDEETGYDLVDLLEQINKLPYIKRVTLSSVDPAPEVTKRLIQFVGTNRDKFVSYILLATQSGSDIVLKMMKRRHTTQQLRELHELASKYKITLGWEIIVGFPGETEELFKETLQMVDKYAPFTQCIFKYSPRKGTPAAEYENQVPEEVKEKRVKAIKRSLNRSAEGSVGSYSFFKNYTREYLCNRHYDNMLNKIVEDDLSDYAPVYLDSDENIIQTIRTVGMNTILLMDYRATDEDEIRLCFLREQLKGNSMILYVDDTFTEDFKEFGSYYGCLVIRRRKHG